MQLDGQTGLDYTVLVRYESSTSFMRTSYLNLLYPTPLFLSSPLLSFLFMRTSCFARTDARTDTGESTVSIVEKQIVDLDKYGKVSTNYAFNFLPRQYVAKNRIKISLE